MKSDDFWEKLNKIADEAARRVASNWDYRVQSEDLRQEVLLKVLNEPNTQQVLRAASDKDMSNYVYRMCTRTCSTLVTEYEMHSDQWIYTTDQVKGLLNEGLLEHEPAEFDAVGVDLEEGMHNLWARRPQYAEAITSRYSAGGIVPERNSAEQSLVSRGIRSLTHEMNNIGKTRYRRWLDTGGPGARKARS